MSTIAAIVSDSTLIAVSPANDEMRLVIAARAGDEAAFVALVERYHPALVHLATIFVPTRSVAEEMAQATWLALLQETARPDLRSSLKVMLFGSLIRRARRHGATREVTIPFSALVKTALADDEPAVDPGRFLPAGGESGSHWATPPLDWGTMPDARLLTPETRTRIEAAIAALPLGQRAVIALRDVEGCTAGEVRAILGLTEADQRALLHRARSNVRAALERQLVAA